jgi:hypothetical protein
MDTFADVKAAQYVLPLCQIKNHGTDVTLFTRILKVTAAKTFLVKLFKVMPPSYFSRSRLHLI